MCLVTYKLEITKTVYNYYSKNLNTPNFKKKMDPTGFEDIRPIVEILMWVGFVAGMFWIPGISVMGICGAAFNMILFIYAILGLLAISDTYTFDDWLMGWGLKYTINYFLFFFAVYGAYVPIVNLVTSPLFGYLAVANLYDF